MKKDQEKDKEQKINYKMSLLKNLIKQSILNFYKTTKKWLKFRLQFFNRFCRFREY